MEQGQIEQTQNSLDKKFAIIKKSLYQPSNLKALTRCRHWTNHLLGKWSFKDASELMSNQIKKTLYAQSINSTDSKNLRFLPNSIRLEQFM